jgi:nucleoside phosphorylase
VRVLVTFALETEFAPWRALRKFRRAKWETASVFRTEIGEAEVNVLLTGVGAPHAALMSLSEIARGESDTVEFCVSAGLAGALQPEYRIGQVLAARTIVAERAAEGAGSRTMESSAPLLEFAGDCGATIVKRFYTAGHVVSRAEEKEQLGLAADAVEMESFAILSRARANGVPGVAIRSISDTVNEDLPLPMDDLFDESGAVSLPRVIGQVARRPGAIPGLVKLGQQSKRAAESLASFLDRYVAGFSERAKALQFKSVTAPN